MILENLCCYLITRAAREKFVKVKSMRDCKRCDTGTTAVHFFLSFNSPSFCGIAANNLQEKTHQCVFQFIYLTSICLLLVYECISRRANFAQTYAISDYRGFILGGKGWGYVQPRAKHDPFRQTNKKYFRLSNLLIENSISHNLKIKMHEKTHRACTVSIP